MDQEPKLPTPMIDPADVADAILGAARKPERDVKVGMMAKMNTTMSKIAPSLGDKMSAMQVDRQQRDELPRNPEGTLYKPSEDGRTHGEGSKSHTAPAETEAELATPGRRS